MKLTVAKTLPLLIVLISAVSCRRNSEPESSFVTDAIGPLAQSRYEMMQKISDHRDIPIPREFHRIMKAASSADWVSVSNGYEQIWRQSHWFESDEPADPRFVNELWHPLHETYWTFKYLMGWPPELIQEYCRSILDGIPSNSLVFTGSDPARFLLGSLAPEFGRNDIAFISQNALADNTYMNYVQDLYDERLWIPVKEQRTAAFTTYVQAINEGSIQLDRATNTNGRIHIDGITSVMWINGYLAQMIAHSNRAATRIFVDEAYIIPWMTPCLQPHGLITELMPASLTNISAQEINEDMAYWNDVEERLASTYHFADSEWSGQAYAMMRATIAGIYAYHKRYEEAEAAFRQAMSMAPKYPEPAFRLATQVLAPQGRIKEAEEVLQELKTKYPENIHYEESIQKIKNTQ